MASAGQVAPQQVEGDRVGAAAQRGEEADRRRHRRQRRSVNGGRVERAAARGHVDRGSGN